MKTWKIGLVALILIVTGLFVIAMTAIASAQPKQNVLTPNMSSFLMPVQDWEFPKYNARWLTLYGDTETSRVFQQAWYNYREVNVLKTEIADLRKQLKALGAPAIDKILARLARYDAIIEREKLDRKVVDPNEGR